ncbi:S-layer family protein [Paenibacillus taihuensis]|uniref:S-layer family protein n=1 Tax=Paenibacillus taihuensis TaxID=1156355 RepID=A0A3D9S898_9BACL|nr:S-layer homology domain-containing protein [Paenibacillus taihuensis]REE88935.1 S-layer family protein [Paenibacillus taihuensis]
MKTLQPAATVTVQASASSKSSVFSDLATKWTWAAEAIGYLAEHDILSGTGGGKFEPEKPVNGGHSVSDAYASELLIRCDR